MPSYFIPQEPSGLGSELTEASSRGGSRPTLRTAQSTVMLAGLVVAGLLVVPGTATTPGEFAGGPGPFAVYAGPTSASQIHQLGQIIGLQPAYAMDFLDGTSWQTIVASSAQLPSQWPGFQMIWGVDMLPGTGGTLAAGATGVYDQYFQQVAQNLVAGGQANSTVRLGWEFNGGWFPWAAGGDPSSFVAFWQHIVNAMRSVPGANFKFEWNPTLGDFGIGDLANYYPGDNSVDLIGLDVYDLAWGSYAGIDQVFNNIVTQPFGLDWLAQFAGQHHKGITLPEWGLGWGPSNAGGPVVANNTQVSGGDDPTFINDMAGWIATHNVVQATFWDYGTSIVGGGSNPNTLAALVKDFGPGGVASASGVINPTPTTTTSSPSTTTTTSPTTTTTASPTTTTTSPTTTTTTSPSTTTTSPTTTTTASPTTTTTSTTVANTTTTTTASPTTTTSTTVPTTTTTSTSTSAKTSATTSPGPSGTNSSNIRPILPSVYSLSPNWGPSRGGTKVTIRGHGYAKGDTVYFGKTVATNMRVRSGTILTVIAPPGLGTVDVTVFGSGTTSPQSPSDRFTYLARGTASSSHHIAVRNGA